MSATSYFLSQGVAAVKAGSGPMPDYVGPIATRGYVPNGGDFNAGLTGVMCRRAHFARDVVTDVQLIYEDWFVNGVSGAEIGIGGTMTIRASIEYPEGVIHKQILFSGSAAGTTASGNELVSDLMDGVSIPTNAQFWTRTLQTNPNGVTYNIQGTQGLGDRLEFSSTDKTMGGTVTDGVPGFSYGPAAILGTTRKRSVYILGTSRSAGIKDTFDMTGDYGIVARSVGQTNAYINGGIPSDKASTYKANHAKRDLLIARCSDIYVELGANDTPGAALQVDLSTIYALYPTKRVHGVTVAPVTDGAWSDPSGADQTSSKNFAADNTFIKALPGGIVDVLDAAAAEVITATPSKWKAPGYTDDGIHELATATAAVKAACQPGVAASLAAPYVAPPAPAIAFDTGASPGTVSFLESNARMTVASGSNQGARSTTSVASGTGSAKITLVNSVGSTVGIVNGSGLLNNWMAGNGNGLAYDPANGNVFMNGSNQGASGIGTATTGDVIEQEVDRTAGTVRFRKNAGAWGNVFASIPAGAVFFAAAGSTGFSARIAL